MTEIETGKGMIETEIVIAAEEEMTGIETEIAKGKVHKKSANYQFFGHKLTSNIEKKA